MKKIFYFIILAGLTSIFTSCYKDPRTVDPAAAPVRSGTANFRKYIAVGNSLTAGFADGGLYNAGIIGSYPNLLATQFRLAGGGAFVQPLFLDNASNGTPYRKQVGLPSATNIPQLFDNAVSTANNCGDNNRFVSSPSAYGPLFPILQPYTGSPLNNLGVPGIRVSHSKVSGFGRDRAFGLNVFFNHYYERMLNSSNRDFSYEQYVAAQATDATFFTCWLGNNDVLTYATSGAPDSPNFLNNMTEESDFRTNFEAMMGILSANGRKGVLVTIPYVERAPFFTTVILNGNSQNPGLRERYLANGGEINLTDPTTDNDGIWIKAKGGDRIATNGDLFLLTSQANYITLGTGTIKYGSKDNPITDENVLDSGEVAEIKARTDAFNNIISSYNTIVNPNAGQPGQPARLPNPNVAVVNINNAVLDQLASSTGFTSFGITYRNTYLQGGAFSTDGIHLTPAGYAVVANEIIKASNIRFGSAIPLINTSGFTGLRIYGSICQNP